MTEKVRVCPLMGGKPCLGDGQYNEVTKALDTCMFWIHVQGTNPNTKESVNEPGCSFVWLPILLMDNTKVALETSGAIESMRNESVNTGQSLAAAIVQSLHTNKPAPVPLYAPSDDKMIEVKSDLESENA